MSVSEVTSSSITVQWGSVDCIHRNGDITGYSVWYGVQGSAVEEQTVPGGDTRQTTISGLTPSTTYSIEVAAVNSAGTGVYSSAIYNLTQGIHVHVYDNVYIYDSQFKVMCNLCSCHLYFQLKLQSCQLVLQQTPPSPSPGLVLAQW